MISFWERTHFLEFDFLIIGSGIVGLNTALRLKDLHKNANIAILEKGLFPSGASTKNAGFACFGSLTELLSDIEKYGEEQTCSLVNKRWEGLQSLRQLLGDDPIDFQQNGGYELIQQSNQKAIEQIPYLNRLLKPIFQDDVFSIVDHKIDAFGFNKDEVQHLVFNRFEGQIDTGRMMNSLIQKAIQTGIQIFNHTEVSHLEQNENLVHVHLKDANELFFKATKVGICTNGFTQNIFPDLDVKPGRGQVLITHPIPNLPFKGTFHMEEGYFYFRNYHNRVLFGGGRHLDFEGETTTELSTTTYMIDELTSRLKNTILPGIDFKIDMKWSGIMGFGIDKSPILRKYSSNIYLGVKMGGMGVAIGTDIGNNLAQLMSKD